MSKSLSFGHVVWADFPYDEANIVKKRLVMVLADLGDQIVAAYITTNQEREGGIHVGAVVDARTALLVPNRYAVISKRNVYWNASEQTYVVARINLAKHREAAAIVRAIILIARNGGYDRFGATILSVLQRAVEIADAARQHQQESACLTPSRPYLRTPMPTTANSLRLSVR